MFVGDDQANTLIGMGGNDYLVGGGGDDYLVGGEGFDTMTGGAGADVFEFNGPDADGTKQWVEEITDFDVTEDTIHLDGTSAADFDDLTIVQRSTASGDATFVNYGSGSIRLSGDIGGDLTSANFTFGETDLNISPDRTSANGLNLTDRMSDGDATQSSEYQGGLYVASEVLDGDTTTFNHTGGGDASPTLTFDLGQDQLLEGVSLVNRTAANNTDLILSRLEGATVTVLDDGDVVWVSEALTSDLNQYLDLDGVTGDTIEITSATTYLHLGEVDIFTEFDATEWDDLIEEMRDTVTVTQSTNYDPTQYLAENAIDGSTSNFTHTHISDSAPELSVQLGDDAEIHYIDIFNRTADTWKTLVQSRLEGAVVEILDDEQVVWTSEELNANLQQLMYTGGVVGDEVRITHDAGNYLHIAEIDIYGDISFA
ncbi:MAG: discoidin domain-containing protein [Pseudomonadota bacterium]